MEERDQKAVQDHQAESISEKTDEVSKKRGRPVKKGAVSARTVRRRKHEIRETFEKLTKTYHLQGKILWDDDAETHTDEEIALIARRIAEVRDKNNLPMKGIEAVLNRDCTNAKAKAYLVQQFISQVNNEMDREVKKWHSNDVIVVDIEDLLRYLIKNTYKNEEWAHDLRVRQLLDIKISGDGRKSSRSCPFLLLTLTIINSNATFSAKHCYTIALARRKEGRKPITQVLRPIMKQFANINKKKGLVIDGVKVQLELFLCADWKFMALVLGLNAANSQWFCLWCLCQSDERPHLTDWSSYLRSTENLKGGVCTSDNCRNGTGRSHPHGVTHDCLLDSDIFFMKNVILDVLHQRLRVSEVLLDGLIEFVTSREREKQLTLECLKVGVTFEKLETRKQKNNTEEWTPLDGNNKKRLLQKLNLEVLLEGHPEAVKFKKMWVYYDWMDDYLHSLDPKKAQLDIQSVVEYEQFALDFFLLVRTVLGEHKITPYIHALVFHVPDMLREHGNIAKFSCSAQELKNQLQTRVMTHQTYVKEAAQQLIEQEHRMLWYDANPKAFEGETSGRKRRRNGEIDVMKLYRDSL